MEQMIKPIEIFFIIIFIGLLSSSLIILAMELFRKEDEITDNTDNTDTNKDSNLVNSKTLDLYSIKEMENVYTFLNNVILHKTDEIIESEILPYYSANKNIDKSKLKELKARIFYEVSLFLNKEAKNLLKKYFNEDGIKRHIQNEFINYLNKVDKKFNNKNKIDVDQFTQFLK